MSQEQYYHFFKMEGTANDYIFVDRRDDRVLLPDDLKAALPLLCDRHRGIGADGLVLIGAPSRPGSLARMHMWNADGSASDMCGNALRCIALFLHRAGAEDQFTIESAVGTHACRVLDAESRSARVEVDMGLPRFEASDIPFNPEALGLKERAGPWLDVPLTIQDQQFRASLVSMGNPHCVIFVERADDVDLRELGPLLERHAAFPERANVEFVSRQGNGASFYQRTFERGSGETLACGSGACAVLAAAVLTGRSALSASIRLRGGVLDLTWQGEATNPGSILMTGQARLVFEGDFRARDFPS